MRLRLLPVLAILAHVLLSAAIPARGSAQEPASCLSPDPAAWPASSRPYFLVIADTSGSMTSVVGGGTPIASSCGYGTDRRAHLRCALRNVFTAFGGQANFGLGTFPRRQTTCSASCFGGCTYADYPGNLTSPGCGSGSGATRRGLFVQVPVQRDSFWATPPPPSNVPALLSWVDNTCTGNNELFADGFTPLNGALRDAYRYLSASGWTAQDGSVTYPTPLAAQDLSGIGVNGGTGCRSVNVLLITDGDETCDTTADAVNAAATLYNTGVTVGGRTFKVRTYVVNFAGGSIALADQIAAAGGTGTSIFANDEAGLSVALTNILSGAARPETCDNLDNNCNGCTDEGFGHYCHSGQTCCAWATAAQRSTCLANYAASITPAAPRGNTALLPCTTATQASSPPTWLCYQPVESCDAADNDCDGRVDEGHTLCGSPVHCPAAEVCNGLDDDCDGVTDDGVCSGCVPSPEVCDGCDNDCDGIADDGIAAVPCGSASPAWCAGTTSCPPRASAPGACIAGGGWTACSSAPRAETGCDGIDDDCDGIADDGVPPTACVPAGTPAGLSYGGSSACQRGALACGSSSCVGFVGPAVESCNGIDDDCDGVVDDGVPGVGTACGSNQPPCSPGVVACVSGALVCQGGVAPRPELCNGVDDDCDARIDDEPLADAPADLGCWNGAGNCCTAGARTWCPPPGATCTGRGGLSDSCAAGRLACAGAAGWSCSGELAPVAEVCNGQDDDCNGIADDGTVAGVGAPCGSDVGECSTGIGTCAGGALACTGEVAPTAEVCDGEDDDCNGVADDGIPAGAACTVPYDDVAFPGDRTSGECAQGALGCDPTRGAVCVGGIGPAAELCNGLDDDCDGSVDETGPAPDGLDGTASPSDPTRVLGAACGSTEGTCAGGVYACTGGEVACGAAPTDETCNCLDDDCDGTRDEDGASALCAPGRTCSEHGGSCRCTSACTADDECPAGWRCDDVLVSETGAPGGRACVPDACIDCASRWIEAGGVVTCAPEGTELPGCVRPPVCACTDAGCGDPCAGVVCAEGTACAQRGPAAGTCIEPRCPEVPCAGCDQRCAPDGMCVADPCAGDPCGPGATCVPSEDLRDHTCERADAGVADASTADGGGFDGGTTGGVGGGCGCAVPGRTGGDPPWSLALLLALVVVRRRRRAVPILALALAAVLVGCGGETASDAGSIDSGSIDSGALDSGSVDAAVVDACAPADETCNGRDDDCDGEIDDVDPTDVRTCGGCGLDCTVEAAGCVRTEIACDAAACVCMQCAPGLFDPDGDGRCDVACEAIATDDAVCDARDADCDGRTDEDVDFCVSGDCGGCGVTCEGAPHATASCEVTGPSCRTGDARCVVGACVCTGPTDCWHDLDGDATNGCEYACSPTGVETCNGLDDDCDGAIDDDLGGDPSVGAACWGDPDGVCAAPEHAGTTTCVEGALVCAGPAILVEGSVAETCNGIDDDCDGTIDDGPSDVGGLCGTSTTLPCRLGTTQCMGGVAVCVGAVEPGSELCNGRDDDCDGAIDDAPSDVGGACDQRPAPPPGATSPCRPGTLACAGGRLLCAGATGPTATLDACGEDSNCDGALSAQPDPTRDVRHCGGCGNDCLAGAVHATWTCVASTCSFQGCQAGYYDLDGDRRCEYACTFISSTEACNGGDDDCDGRIDEGVARPPLTQICGTSPSATAPECTAGVTASCVAGAWQCTFPAGVCAGGCGAATEVCDALDNDCDGLVNENVAAWGTPCASDDGLPAPGHGACRTTGTVQCTGPGTVACSAVRADCASLPGGCTELCDGIDNDCDGSTDEPFTARGTDATSFVRPAVTRVGTALWMYSFEATRPGATATTGGSGNGYWTSAPAGRTIDRTPACSAAGRIPWTGVTPQEAQQVCTAMGGSLCQRAQYQTACTPNTSCTYGYAPRGGAGSACATSFTATKFCNLGPSYDFSPAIAGDQDGLLVTASPVLNNCWADWSALHGNTAATARVFDLTGNVREITSDGPGVFRAMGGSYQTASEAGAACGFTFYSVDASYQSPDLGFRCCFTSDPTL